MNTPPAIYAAPPRSTFWQKLGPGGAMSLLVALVGAALVVPVLWRLAQVIRTAREEDLAPADLILVLGRRLEADRPTAVFEARLAHAADLWRRGLAPRVLVAGGLTGHATLTEGEAGRTWLRSQGLPEACLQVEGRSQHTLENLFFVREEMRVQGLRTALLVTDPLHEARARAMARGLGMDVRPAPARACPPRPGTLSWYRRASLEAFFLHWYLTGLRYSRLIRSRAQLARVT